MEDASPCPSLPSPPTNIIPNNLPVPRQERTAGPRSANAAAQEVSLPGWSSQRAPGERGSMWFAFCPGERWLQKQANNFGLLREPELAAGELAAHKAGLFTGTSKQTDSRAFLDASVSPSSTPCPEAQMKSMTQAVAMVTWGRLGCRQGGHGALQSRDLWPGLFCKKCQRELRELSICDFWFNKVKQERMTWILSN